ncbi:cofactor assembly of complex C subunit B [Synechococcus sp. Nb3U1]|uniref:cofactor assembly of complex C subunit B n=1 Tax=Synechococcus sp. Nb3U1 TaxID=1914529 RepID=UPI001F34BDCA|nr:cofactor assembly of complex C subunit B [Synechococcus sp. Nb3U1]MCF2970358.1 cofactor assembly of complex C subunit B [Synechococcus sp. Nb3U1]
MVEGKLAMVEKLSRSRVSSTQALGLAIALPDSTLRGETVSTLTLTALLAIGLFFFLRASGKDRVEARLYSSNRSLEEMGSALRSHLRGRGYQLQSTDSEGIATFAGEARASAGLAAFLTGLAGLGLACLALVVHTLEPQWGGWPWMLMLASPWAGWYYRQRNQRPEQVRLKLQEAELGARLWVEGHRDELDVLAATFALQERDPDEG